MQRKLLTIAFVVSSVISTMAWAASPPTDGLVLWLDARDRGQLELDDQQNVNAWHDRSPAKNHAKPPNESKTPEWVEDGINGRPAVRFAGDAWLRVPPLASGPGQVTLFAVFYRPPGMASDSKWQRILSCWNRESDGDNKPPSFQLSIKEGSEVKPAIFVEMMSGRDRGEMWLGANMRYGSNRLQGLIGEVLVYDRGFLVDQQVREVKRYLREKWGIPVNPDEAWTRHGKLVDVPQRTSDRLPLSDQSNEQNWDPLRRLWDEFEQDQLDNDKWWDHNPTWYGRAPARFLGEGQNVHVRNGKLELVMKRDDSLPRVKLYRNGEEYHSYSSASVVSKSLVRYGYFEVSAKAMDSGGSSAFWFSSRVKHRPTGKPYRSEIDVFEIGGKAPGHETAYHMNAHIFETPQDGRRHWNQGGTWQAPFHFTDTCHVFGFAWTPDELTYFVDGVPVRRMKNTHWHAPLRLIFDSETMGSWLGMPRDEDLPSTFYVEYVRAWKNSETDSDWRDEFEPFSDPREPTRITEYVRSMDDHGQDAE